MGDEMSPFPVFLRLPPTLKTQTVFIDATWTIKDLKSKIKVGEIASFICIEMSLLCFPGNSLFSH